MNPEAERIVKESFLVHFTGKKESAKKSGHGLRLPNGEYAAVITDGRRGLHRDQLRADWSFIVAQAEQMAELLTSGQSYIGIIIFDDASYWVGRPRDEHSGMIMRRRASTFCIRLRSYKHRCVTYYSCM